MNNSLAQPIAIFGGTFDPIHHGHLYVALELQQAYNLAEVRLVPCWQPVHRAPAIATAKQRLDMLAWAVKNEPKLKIDDCEIQRQTPSYMVDTISLFRKKLSNTPLCLILGIDAWIGFAEWHSYEIILQLCHIIIVQRPFYFLPSTGKVAKLFQQYSNQDVSAMHHSLGGYIFFHPTTSPNISATAIRDQFAKNQDPRHLLPESVYHYIIKHGIYH
ncbi:MAG: nadD [Gammaproteobacteria bacterium]|jgi:nicotinate-nucleotide adenylyltransferase|nr:nadD [Gammaproteobacteria bacterium]